MIRADFHVHTTFCDGAASPREMVEAAIQKGMKAIGFSSHAHTAFDAGYCLKRENTEAYRREILALSNEYADKIRIYCGIEADLYGDTPLSGFSYVIGSVHYVKKDGVFLSVDHSPEVFQKNVETHFGGDYYAFAESYFEAVATVPATLHPTFIGHFDLVSKFNQGGARFDAAHPRYQNAWKNALSTLLESGLPFEVNTGAISRGYRDFPYPAREQLEMIRDRGGRVLLSGDAHTPSSLGFEFEKWEPVLHEIGVELITPEDLL